MGVSLQIVEDSIDVRDYLLAGLNRATQKGLDDTGKRWKGQYLPDHFRAGAGQRYKYRQRSIKYQNLKNRKGKGPLQWSGLLKRRVKTALIKASTKRVVVQMDQPTKGGFRYAFALKGRGRKSRVAEELIRTTRKQRRILGETLRERTIMHLREDPTARKKTKKRRA